MSSLDGVKILYSALSDLLWRYLATKPLERSSRSMVGYEASLWGNNIDPVKICAKPHRFGVAAPPRSLRITSDLRKNRVN